MQAVVLCAVATIAASLSDGAASRAANQSRPNIIFLLTDDQDLTLSGLDVMPTVTSRILREGLRFENGFVTTPICCPSRTSILTSQYAHNLADQSLGWCGTFPQRENATWVQALAQAGYRTGLFGKYYNTYSDYCGKSIHVPRGWEEFYAMCSDSVYFGNLFNDNGVNTALQPGEYLTAAIGNRTVSWLQDVVTNPDGRPFFAYVAPHAPHVPATPAPWVWSTPLPSTKAPRVPNWNISCPDRQWTVAGQPPLDAVMETYSDELYMRRLLCLISVDDILREMIAVLEASNQLNNTFIFYSSDHGYNLGNFRLPSGKFHPYENDIRVPFAVRGPGIVANSSTSAMSANIDLGPTFLQLAGLPVPAEYDGRSLLPVMFPNSTTTSDQFHPGNDEASTGVVLPTPAGWRDKLLIEYWSMGYVWRGPCTNGSAPCPNGPEALLDSPGNTWAGLRVINATHNWMYVEFRDRQNAASPLFTNVTEVYNVAVDSFQLSNLATTLPAPVIASWSSELWGYANCSTAAFCP